MGRRPREFIHPDDRDRILTIVYGAAERREQPPCPIEYRMLRKDGSVAWLEAGPRLIFDPDGAIVGWMDVVRDIGARKALEAEAAAEHAARLRAEDADRAKTQFLSTVSHELRTPLNAIIGYAELLQEEGEPTVAADAERIRRAGRHLLDLINQILDMGKIEAGMMEAHPTDIDLRMLLEEVCDTVEPLATRNGNVMELRIGPHVGEARTDGRLLKQCLLNLASNACKFTENGHVRIEAEVRPTPRGLALACEVADTGVGIPPGGGGAAVPAFRAGRSEHDAQVRRYGPRPRPDAALRTASGRRRDPDQRTGARLGVHAHRHGRTGQPRGLTGHLFQRRADQRGGLHIGAERL